MTRDEVIKGLREAADFIEQHPEIPIWEHVSPAYGFADLKVIAGSREEFAEVARALGKADKDYSGDFATVERVVGLVRLGALGARETVCERVVTGTETVEQPVMEQVGTETVEREIVEWRCDEPILGKAA